MVYVISDMMGRAEVVAEVPRGAPELDRKRKGRTCGRRKLLSRAAKPGKEVKWKQEGKTEKSIAGRGNHVSKGLECRNFV